MVSFDYYYDYVVCYDFDQFDYKNPLDNHLGEEYFLLLIHDCHI